VKTQGTGPTGCGLNRGAGMRKFWAVALATMVAIGVGASVAGASGGATSPTKISSCADFQTLSNSVESTFANLTGSSGQFKSVAKQLRASVSSVPPGALVLGGTVKPVNVQASIKKLAKVFDQLAGGDLVSRAGVIKAQKKVFGKADFDLSDFVVNNCPGLKTG
jgi:hypothetical protein